MSKAAVPKGTRDFSPEEMLRRNYIFGVIKKYFIRFGYQPIETPAMENLETLTGKYGEEGDQLLFKVLERGEKLIKAVEQVNPESTLGKMEHLLCSQALRYDLTVPFARFVVQHQNELSFPFKRYQIQPVWRADRPQKGRYREFYQCDADVVGSDSLIYEVELVQLIDEVFSELGIKDFTIKINNRKVLSAIAEITGMSEKIVDITVAIDKLDKIGESGVVKELSEKGIPENAIALIKPLFSLSGDYQVVLDQMRRLLANSEIGLKGLDELTFIFNAVHRVGLKTANFAFDVTLARGLNYYTGAIFEVKVNDVNIGSVSGGGRYDDLTGIFGLKDISGVGISFGADRIYDVLNELSLFPDFDADSTQVLIINFEDKEMESLLLVNELRQKGINSELYPSASKLKKQLKYANGKHIKFVVFPQEEGKVELKNMVSGDQQILNSADLWQIIKA